MHVQARAGVKIANLVFGMIEHVLNMKWNSDFVVLFLESSERSKYFLNLIWEQDGFHGLKYNLADIFLRDFPFIFKRHSRLVFYAKLLVLGDS